MPMHYSYVSGLVYQHVVLDSRTLTIAYDNASMKPQLCAGAKAVAIQFTEKGTVNNRSGVLKVYVSADGGTTFTQHNMLVDNVANTNAQNLTRVSSKTRAAAGTDLLFLEPASLGGITHFKVDLAITDGADPTGSFDVKASIMY